MSRRGFLAVFRRNVEFAAWAAAPSGWSARPACRADLDAIGAAGKAVELTHPDAALPVLLVEQSGSYLGTASGAYLHLPSSSSRVLPLLPLCDPVVQELIRTLGGLARGRERTGIEGGMIAEESRTPLVA